MAEMNEGFRRRAIEQTPFEDPLERQFFDTWAKVMDTVHPVFVDRAIFENQEQVLVDESQVNDAQLKRAIEKRRKEFEQKCTSDKRYREVHPDGIRFSVLYLPRDLKLWEMPAILYEVDKDTFEDDPDLQKAKRDELHDLGENFRDAGLYIGSRLEAVEEGYRLAEQTAEDFFQYGEALVAGAQFPLPEDMTLYARRNSLTPERTDAIDRWLAGEKLYQSRMQRIPEEDEEAREQMRRHTLQQYFRVLDRAYDMQHQERRSTEVYVEREQQDRAWRSYEPLILESQERELSPREQAAMQKMESVIFAHEPWKRRRSVHERFLETHQRRQIDRIDTPHRELTGSLYRRGAEFLIQDMRVSSIDEKYGEVWEGLGHAVQKEEQRILKALRLEKDRQRLDELRSELRQAEQVDSEEAEDLRREIGDFERSVAHKIQTLVSQFEYEGDTDKPAEMIVNQRLNCVGASLLGGALLAYVGIRYLVTSIPEHSCTLLVTSDDRIFWQDMLNTKQTEIFDEDFEGVRVRDVVSASQDPEERGMMLEFSDSVDTARIFTWHGKRNTYIYLAHPSVGHQAQILNNIGSEEKESSKAITILDKAVDLVDSPRVYTSIAMDYRKEGNIALAIAANQKAIELAPKMYDAYVTLGRTYKDDGKNAEAAECLRRAISLRSDVSDAYLELGLLHAREGKFDEANRENNYALQFHTESNPRTTERIAELYKTSGSYQKAREVYGRLLIEGDDRDMRYVQEQLREIHRLEKEKKSS